MIQVSTMILMQQLLSRKLGDNIVTVTNNVCGSFLEYHIHTHNNSPPIGDRYHVGHVRSKSFS